MATPRFTIQKETVSKPQALTQIQFDRFAEGTRRDLRAMTEGAKLQAAKRENLKAERISQEALQAEQNQWVINQYARVGELKEIGYDSFDKSKDDFFNGQIDKYVKIKNGIDNGTVPADVGGKALSKINDQVLAFSNAAPEILAQAKLLEEAMQVPDGEAGGVSVVNPTAQQEILLKLIQGKDVKIVDHEGELVLFMPPGVSDISPQGGMINVNELINLEAQGKEYIRTIPDLTNPLKTSFVGIVGDKESGFNMGSENIDTRESIFKDGEWQPNPNYDKPIGKFMTINTTTEGKQEVTTRTMTREQRENIRRAMITSKGLQPILNDESYMESVWEDMMKKDSKWGIGSHHKGEENWEQKNAEEIRMQQYEAMDWLANKAIDSNAEEVGIQQIIEMKRKPKSPYRPPGPKGVTTEDIDIKIGSVMDALLTIKDNPGNETIAMNEMLSLGQLWNTDIAKIDFAEDGSVMPMKRTGDDEYDQMGPDAGVNVTNPGTVVNLLLSMYDKKYHSIIKQQVTEWYRNNKGKIGEVKMEGKTNVYNPFLETFDPNKPVMLQPPYKSGEDYLREYENE